MAKKNWNYDFTTEEVNESFGKNLREARLAAGYTQTQLASELNYTHTAFANMEAGRNGGTLATLLRLSVVLKTDPTALLRKR